EFWRKRAEYLEANGPQGYESFIKELETAHEQELKELDRFLEVVLQANEPSILPDGSFDELKGWANRNYLGLDGTTEPFLAPDKRAVSSDRALDILTTEVNDGQLDADLFKLFIAGKVFQRQIADDSTT